jgi:hypothetical protein
LPVDTSTTVPVVVGVPSPQSIVAVKSEAVSLGLESPKVGTLVDDGNAAPSVAALKLV